MRRAHQKHADLFAQPTKPRAQVAILVNETNYQINTMLDQSGNPWPGKLAYATRGWYRYLWDAGIPVDFIEFSELDSVYAADYKALILPYPIALSDQKAQQLATLVARGVNLICEALPGRVDEVCYSVRGEMNPIFAELFGVRHDSCVIVREPAGGARWTPPERTYGEFVDAVTLQGEGALAGHSLQAHFYLQTFVPTGSEPVLRDGSRVAGVRRTVGRGSAWLLGTFAGFGGTAYRDDASRNAVLSILRQCGVVPDVCGALLRRRRVAGKKEAWLLTNPHANDVREMVDVKGFRRVTDLFDAPLVREGERVVVDVASLDVAGLILER